MLHRILPFIVSGLLTPLIAADNSGRVELPLSLWQETQSRLAALEEAQKNISPTQIAPPVAKVVNFVRCVITPGESAFLLTTEIEIDNLTRDWITIPLISSIYPLISAEADHGKIIASENGYALVSNHQGIVKIRLVQEVIFPKESESGLSRFWISAANALSFRINPGSDAWNVTVNQRPLTTEGLILPGVDTDGKERLNLEIGRAAANKTEESVSTKPGEWDSRSEAQVKWQDGRLFYRHRLVLLCMEGNPRMAELEIPIGLLFIEVAGDDLEKWSDNKPGRLELIWKKSGLRQRVVNVLFALEHPDILAPWPLIGAVSASSNSLPGLWHLQIPAGIEPRLPQERPLAASLSDWMRELAARDVGAVFPAKPGSAITMDEVRTVVLSDAQVAAADFRTELALGGGMLTEARFELAGNNQAGMILQLEPEARLLACRVDGVVVSPIDLGKGRIRIVPLSTDKTSSVVELTLSQQMAPFNPASGQIRIELPSTPLLTKSTTWSIRLPQEIALSAFDGSVSAGASTGKGEIRFQQQLYRDTSPVVTLFYQKKMK